MGWDISPPGAKRRKISRPTRITHPPSKTSTYSPDVDFILIFSWDINGIAPFLQKLLTSYFQSCKSSVNKSSIPPPSLQGFLQCHNWPAILFLHEVKIATKDIKTQNLVRIAVNTCSQSEKYSSGSIYDIHFTLPNDPHNARGLRGNGKVYGVCSIIRSYLSSTVTSIKVRTVDWDKEGRVSVVELDSPNFNLALFNIYAVNSTDNPYRNPPTGAVSGSQRDRKLAFHKLLMEECISLEVSGRQALIVGDINVAPDV